MNYKSGIADSDHRPILQQIRQREGDAAAVSAIKAEMDGILRHCIECDWSACYTAKFEELVWPYLDDVRVLDTVLRSDVICPTHDVITGKTGSKIFPYLLEMLLNCKDQEILRYLHKEFSSIENRRSPGKR